MTSGRGVEAALSVAKQRRWQRNAGGDAVGFLCRAARGEGEGGSSGCGQAGEVAG